MAQPTADDESAVTMGAMVRTGRRLAADIVRSCLAAIDRSNHALNALREVYAESALAAAHSIDRRAVAGDDPGPLAGVPLVVKDNICTSIGTTACGSRLLSAYRSPFTATAVQRLLNAGAILLGRSNCDEFAMGSSSEHCAFGIVRNPRDHTRVPGGSSGGSAAAVAAGFCPIALGSETGGSVRQPASFCGVVGIKPSYGRVSRWGLVAYGSSLDQIGPFATNVSDAALVLSVMSGADPLDASSADAVVPDPGDIDPTISGLRIGVARSQLGSDNDPAVNEAMEQAIERLRSLGAHVLDIDLPLTRYGVATYYLLATAEASSNLARFDGMRFGHRAAIKAEASLEQLYALSRSEGLGSEVQRRILLGTYALSAGYYEAYYRRATQVRRLIRDEYNQAFVRCHAIIGPVAPTPAFEIGTRSDPLSMYLCDAYTVNANVAGICAMSVPCPTRDMPIGLHIQCQAFAETTMLRIARAFEHESADKC